VVRTTVLTIITSL